MISEHHRSPRSSECVKSVWRWPCYHVSCFSLPLWYFIFLKPKMNLQNSQNPTGKEWDSQRSRLTHIMPCSTISSSSKAWNSPASRYQYFFFFFFKTYIFQIANGALYPFPPRPPTFRDCSKALWSVIVINNAFYMISMNCLIQVFLKHVRSGT